MLSAEKTMTQPRGSLRMMDQIALGVSEVAFKEQDTVLQSIEVPKVRLNDQNINKPLHELPKYNPAEKRKSRYSTTRADAAQSFNFDKATNPIALSIDRNC